jgi:hypothetical protein
MKKILVIFIVTTSFLITGAVFAQVYPEGMISYWKFEEGSGSTTALDSVGNNDGAIEGATYTTGRVGEALDFSGWDEVTVSNNQTLNPAHVTIEAWVYPTIHSYYRTVISKLYSNAWVNPWSGYRLSIPWNVDRPAFSVAIGGQRYIKQSDSPIPMNAWSHLVCTYDGNAARIYINGQLASTDESPTGPIDNSTGPLYIGEIPGTNNRYYGKIDEVAIYDRALTLEEIQQHYQNGLDGQGYEELVPQISCVGFEPPMAAGPVKVKKNRALPHKGQLESAEGYAVTGADITATPVIQVLYDSGMGGDPVDVTDDALASGMGSDGNQFVWTEDEKWQFNLKTNNYTAPGTYKVTMQSGDDSEYVIDPTCESQFVVK